MAIQTDDRARRLTYAELEAEMNAIATPDWTPEVEAHFQKVFAAFQRAFIDGPMEQSREDAGDESFFESEPRRR